MSLLGIDVGTTAVKIALFNEAGSLLSACQDEHREYHPAPGLAELNAEEVWLNVKDGIRTVMRQAGSSRVTALSVSSMGEAVVPVSADRRILAPSILNYDPRGEEFLADLQSAFRSELLFPINGNTLGNHYSLTKLKWIQVHQPECYAQTYKFLHWSAFIGFMLGAEPAVDYTLANRTLLFDLKTGDWSDALLRQSGLDREKLPRCVPSGTAIGTVSAVIADELGLPADVQIVSGAHDQCANALGCGVTEAGSAVYGMGTYLCITPVYAAPKPADLMIARGLNTEHHAVPGKYVSFLYNQGGTLVKWFRDTFAAQEHQQALGQGKSVYPSLFAEMPAAISSVFVLPHFAPTGPPEFISNSSGVISGLRLETTRGDILKGIIEGAAFYLKELVDSLPETGIVIESYRAAGGGSQSDAWVQLSADIFGKPFTRPRVTEAGALGAAIMAGVGNGSFNDYIEGTAAMVQIEHAFEPDPQRHALYQERFARYRQLAPLIQGFLTHA